MTEEQETVLMIRFIEFMKEKKLDRYLDNYLSLDCTPYLWVSSVIIWADTKEGFHYWNAIEHDWNKLLEELK